MLEAGFTNTYGDRVIDIDLKRHKLGVKVSVKVVSEVEEFFKRWGGGEPCAPSMGRLWKSLDGQLLRVWSFDTQLGEDQDQAYSLSHTGCGFYTEHGTINLSCIRLVGASEGCEFICDSVVGRSELDKIAQKLKRAEEHFYTEYIQQVHLNIFVAVKDMRDRGNEV